MTEATNPRPIRRIGAVLAGLLFVIIVTTLTDLFMHKTGIFPALGMVMSDALFLVALAYRIIYGIAGGYITARLAPDKPMTHALVLGVIGCLLAILGTVATWNSGPELGPKWYPIALIVIAIPTTWIGGKLIPSAKRL
jgi:hypothetical protein